MTNHKIHWTTADILALKPCYSPDRVQELFGPADTLTLRAMLTLDIPRQDRLWLAFCPDMLTLSQIDRLFVVFKEEQSADARADARASAYARADADADAYARASADARAHAYARASAYACARAYASAYAYARADADAYASASADADAYADARAYAYASADARAHADALQAQLDDILTILTEDNQ